MSEITENNTAIPAGYYKNAKGYLVPDNLVRPEEKLEDQMVEKIIGYAEALNAQIGRFKGHTGDDVSSFLSLIDEKYGLKRGQGRDFRKHRLRRGIADGKGLD